MLTCQDLIGKYFKKNPAARAKVFLATKYANKWQPDGSMTVDSSPEYTKAACAKSLQRLGVDTIDLYYVYAGCVRLCSAVADLSMQSPCRQGHAY